MKISAIWFSPKDKNEYNILNDLDKNADIPFFIEEEIIEENGSMMVSPSHEVGSWTIEKLMVFKEMIANRLEVNELNKKFKSLIEEVKN